MAHMNPKGRANYEPNSWVTGGPREDAVDGYQTFPAPVTGEMRKVRAELFADHYSQARLFYRSQTPVEQDHIASALVFELSRCEVPAIRARMVAHLPNIDEGLAATVAEGLGMAPPAPHDPRAPVMDMAPSDALSILKQGPAGFKGRKMGILVLDGVDDDLVATLVDSVLAANAVPALIAPRVGGVVTAGGVQLAARHALSGAPSVLFDAVAVLGGDDDPTVLMTNVKLREFIADAVHHGKFIGLSAALRDQLAGVGIDAQHPGLVDLHMAGDVDAFVATCDHLRTLGTGVYAAETPR